MATVRIARIPADDLSALDQAYAVYRDAILQSEQRTPDEFGAMFARPDYRFLAAWHGDAIAGMAIAWVPANSEIWLLEYVAVRPESRGGQIGANLFRACGEVAGPGRIALVEVDTDTGEAEQARRLSFYRKLGCRRLRGLRYLLPLEAFGTPPPMMMLTQAPATIETFHVELVEDWLRRIYSDVYGKPLSDPRLAAMIDPLPDEIALDAV